MPGSPSAVASPPEQEAAAPVEQPAADPLPQVSVPATRNHSPATRMLIDAELKDATPEERAEWVAYLGSVEAAQVPYILRARRMASNRRLDQVVKGTDGAALVAAAAPANVNPRAVTEIAADQPLPQITPAGGPRPATTPAVVPPEQAAPHVEAPAGPAGISQRIRGLAAPTWSWMQPAENGSAVHADESKPERSVFGLPQRFGGNPKNVPAPLTADHEQATAPQRLAAATNLQVTPGSKLWEDELRKVISLLEAEGTGPTGRDAAAQFEQRRRQVALRMLHLVNDDPNLAQQAIATLPPAEQEFWTAMFVALSDVRDSNLPDDERAARTVSQLRVAAQHLQTIAPLQLRNLIRCEEINGFGNYRPAAVDEVAPGQSILVYAEIRNFHSEPTVEGFYRTAISSTVELVGPNGKVVDRKAYPAEDLCRALRNDYFHSYRIDLPPGLVTGPHTLRLTIRDDLTGRSTTDSLPLEVH